MSQSFQQWTKYIFCPLFLCLFLHKSVAQKGWELEKNSATAYQHILALKLYHQSVNLKDKKPSTLYIKHYRKSIELLITGESDNLSAYDKLTDYVLESIKKYKGDSPYRRFYTAEVLLQSSFVHLKAGNEFTAGWRLRRSFKEIKKNISKHPEFLPHYKTIGLLHILLGSVPDKYNWILSLLGMSGSVQKGLNDLNKLANSSNLFQKEAKILILLMQGYILEKQYKSLKILQEWQRKEPNNLLIGYLTVSVLMKSHQSEQALALIDTIIDYSINEDYIEFIQLYYLKAEALLQKGSYQQAIATYTLFIDKLKSGNYLKDSYYKIGLAYWLLDDYDHMHHYHDLARSTGSTITEADKYADRLLENDTLPNKLLMKSRLFTDGGYYEKAMNMLNKIKKSSTSDKKTQIEINYRKARILHLTHQYNEAIAYYKLTINSGIKNNWYFAPNSALQLGYIYEQQGQKKLAIKYFENALRYKNHEYKNSIDNKAKSALDRIEISE